MRYLEESQGVTDFSPLSGSPPPLSAPFGRGELPPPPPFHFSHSFCARHLLSKLGHQFANSPHTYVIDNRKPLSSADFLLFFQMLVPAPTCHEKMPPRPKNATATHCYTKITRHHPQNNIQLQYSL